ncbi:hypothetical protein LCGC14_3044000 [marine sediment metagenome]|uniref:Uncharacterized protein n=1 Tax=marine sediment metagenome TaxID=412755 RepID=A0A0F8WNP2_9ZZZZ
MFFAPRRRSVVTRHNAVQTGPMAVPAKADEAHSKMREVMGTEVGGQVVRGRTVVLYPRILTVEMFQPFEHEGPLSCYADRIPLAEMERGVVYCREGNSPRSA